MQVKSRQVDLPIQNGVPTAPRTCFFCESPKSATFARNLLSTRTFWAFKSAWITCGVAACRNLIPCATSRRIGSRISPSKSNVSFWSRSNRLPWSMNSIINIGSSLLPITAPLENNNTNATGNPHQEIRIQAPENTHPAQRHSPTTANHPRANTPTQHPLTSEVLRTPQPHVRHTPPTATVREVRPKCAHAKPPRGRKHLAMYIFVFGTFPLKTDLVN